MEDFKLDFTEKVAHIEESTKSAHKRIDGLEKLTNSIYKLASSIESLQNNVTDMSDRIKVIEEKPGKRWDLVIAAVISSLVGAAIAYFV